jgi:AbrB family looped-hinge helix DNA binding protein
VRILAISIFFSRFIARSRKLLVPAGLIVPAAPAVAVMVKCGLGPCASISSQFGGDRQFFVDQNPPWTPAFAPIWGAQRINPWVSCKSIFKIDFLTKAPYISVMTTTITSKGQITIPKKIRERFNLKVGDELEFDETAPTLTARRVINRKQWDDTICEWQDASSSALENHPWQKKSSDELIDDIRGGVAES